MPDPNDDVAEPAPLLCARCACELVAGTGAYYQVTIEAVADPTPPQLAHDVSPEVIRGQITELLGQLNSLSAQEAQDQIYRRMVLHLCVPCYGRWIENPVGES